LTSLAEERSKTNFNLTSLAEERSRTLEYVLNQNLFTEQHQLDQLHKFYVEWMTTVVDLNQKAAFNASSILELQTDYPVAIESYDHISPGSTTEGVSRPTLFVKNCISILGKDIKCLDLGTGAAGLIYEYAMSGVLAVGIDGSDFCRINEIGYWPLLPNNLFNCDITKPFSFLSRDTKTQIGFDVITMWEVLEHIAESDLPNLFSNINRHLVQHGYFIGSISFIEYMDSVGNKYHVTLKPRNWWKEKFFEGGLTMLDTHPFNEKFFCRGNGPRFQDIHNYELNPREGFLFVAQKFCDNSGISA
jgi:2-polyprenyl-3-methyl-5-hydroxy-6-metoxy-1,4-benzoquinol methylase